MLSNKKITLLLGFAIALTFAYFSIPAWKNLGSVYARQVAANERLIEWKSAYEALLPINAKWQSSFVSESEASDLLKLYRLANIEQHGLSANVDLVRQSDGKSLQVNGMDVGLAELCISTLGNAFEVSAPTITSLRSGLRALGQRRDVTLGSIEFSVNSETNVAYAKIKPFCLLVRTGESAPGESPQ